MLSRLVDTPLVRLLCLSGLASLVPIAGLGAQPVSFTDATAASGLLFEHHDAPSLPGLLPQEQTQFGAGGAVSDYDRDGDLDVYLVDSAGFPNRLYSNEGGTFVDVTALAGVGDLGAGHMALFLDLDGDGWDDLVVLNDAGTPGAPDSTFPFSQLYRNLRDGTFENVSAGSGFAPVARIIGGAAASDYDHDGDLDLYVTSWFDLTSTLYRNDGNFRFTDVTERAGLRRPETFVSHWTPVFADVDGDGWQDLFCAVDFSPDYLFLNDRDGSFTLASGTTHEGNDMGVAVADFDRDGDLDLYTTNITQGNDPWPCCNWLYVGDGTGGFTNQAGELGVRDTAWGWGTTFFDADLDGDLDLLAVNGWQGPQWETPATFFVNEGTGTPQFDEQAQLAGIDHVGNSRGLIAFDADRDGDLDLLITDTYSPVTYYENITPRDDRHYLGVRLRGRVSNPHGVGARITVTAGSLSWIHEIVVGGSFYAGPPLEAHFGLGTATVVDEIRVRWPTGREQVLTSVPVDQLIPIEEERPRPASGQLSR